VKHIMFQRIADGSRCHTCHKLCFEVSDFLNTITKSCSHEQYKSISLYCCLAFIKLNEDMSVPVRNGNMWTKSIATPIRLSPSEH